MAVSGRMMLKAEPLPKDIQKLGAEGVNSIWREAKLRGAGMKRVKILISAPGHSVESKEAPETARLEFKNLRQMTRENIAEKVGSAAEVENA